MITITYNITTNIVEINELLIHINLVITKFIIFFYERKYVVQFKRL